MAANAWSQDEINNLTNMYGVVKPKTLFLSFPGRSEGAVKSKVAHMQEDGFLPEAHPWTAKEISFLIDVHRFYSPEELHVYMQHPRWAIAKRCSIISGANNERLCRPWGPVEDEFLITSARDLSVTQSSLMLLREPQDVEERIDALFRIGVFGGATHPSKIAEPLVTPGYSLVECSRCSANIRIRCIEDRVPEVLFCSLRCKFTLPQNRKNFLYLLLEEKKQIAQIAKCFRISSTRCSSLFDIYMPDVEIKQDVPDEKSNNPSIRSGKRSDLKDVYFRSGWEANFARVLNLKKKNWEYEPKTFVFKNISRGSISYTPDFYVKGLDGKRGFTWVEIKGRMNDGDYSKLLNFKRQYPNEFKKLKGVVAKGSKAEKSFKKLGIPILWYYGDIRAEFKSKIKNWEGL